MNYSFKTIIYIQTLFAYPRLPHIGGSSVSVQPHYCNKVAIIGVPFGFRNLVAIRRLLLRLYTPADETPADPADRRLPPAAIALLRHAVPLLADLLGLCAGSHRHARGDQGSLADGQATGEVPSLA